jgi:hypothetical protein
MRFACWIAKATETHSEYVILIAFVRQQWLREALPTRREGSRYKLPGLGAPEGGPGANYVAYFCVFRGNVVICRSYKLTLLDHTQVTLQLRVSLSDLVKKFYPVCLCWVARLFSSPGTWTRSQRPCVNALQCYVYMFIHCLFVSTLYGPDSASEKLVITFCTAQFNITNILRSAHTLYLCVLYVSQQTSIISLHSINWLIFITGRDWAYWAVRAEY